MSERRILSPVSYLTNHKGKARSLLTHYPSSLFCCCDKKQAVKEKTYCGLLHHDRKPRQELTAGPWREEMRQKPWKKLPYLGMVLGPSSVKDGFLPTVGWALPHQLTIRKVSHRHVYRPF